MKRSKRIASILLISVMVLSVTACKGSTENTNGGENNPQISSGEPDSSASTEEPVTIRFFSNLPDRSSSQGQLEQTLIDNYLAEHKNVKIELEALQDEPYKQKFQSYVASNDLPDICMVWGQPAFFEAVMEGGYVAELNPDDYADYGFFGGSTSDFSYDGKLYGLPRNQDATVLYYNKAIFDEYGVEVPATYDELLEAVKIFRENDIAPMSINGKDKWILNLFFQDLFIRVCGNQDKIYDAVDQKISFSSDADIKKTAELYKQLVDAGMFQDSYISADYGAAMNLFLQEKSAMFYMGAWEVGMASNEENSEHFRQNAEIMTFPLVEGGKGKNTDLLAWNGGGFAVSSSSPVKEEAVQLLNYIMDKNHWAKIGWQTGTVVPGQDYSGFLTGEENQLQLEVTEMLQNATSMSGTPWNDYAAGEWKANCEQIMQEFSAGIISVDEFLSKLDEIAAIE